MPQRQAECLEVETAPIRDALEHLDGVLATAVDLAREFLAGMVTGILVRPLPPTTERSRGNHCPLRGLSIKRLTPQNAAEHGLAFEEIAAADPELGVSLPVEVRIRLNMKDLLAKEEVVVIMVAGARNFDMHHLGTPVISLLVK